MSTPSQALDPRALRPPERSRRARRRRGSVLLLFSLVSSAFTGLCVVWLFSDDVQDSPEGMAAFALIVVGFMALLVAIGMLAWGLSVMLRRDVVRQPGWLEDPADPALVRWWDGHAWTEHTSPRDPAVVALEPLTAGSRRRHVRGGVLLVGGVVVAVGAELLSRALFAPPDFSQVDVDGQLASRPMDDLWMVVGQASPFACAVAVVGLYLLLTVDDDPPAGWKPDPLDAARVRWWDGRSWTDATTDATPVETPSA